MHIGSCSRWKSHDSHPSRATVLFASPTVPRVLCYRSTYAAPPLPLGVKTHKRTLTVRTFCAMPSTTPSRGASYFSITDYV